MLLLNWVFKLLQRVSPNFIQATYSAKPRSIQYSYPSGSEKAGQVSFCSSTSTEEKSIHRWSQPEAHNSVPDLGGALIIAQKKIANDRIGLPAIGDIGRNASDRGTAVLALIFPQNDRSILHPGRNLDASGSMSPAVFP
jgi:hypothetical protein